MKFANILVPFDKSEHAMHALTLARGLAEEDSAIRLHVINVVYVSDFPPAIGMNSGPYETLGEFAANPEMYSQLVEAAKKRETEVMHEAIGTTLDTLPNDITIEAVNEPSVTDGIIRYARDHDCDLIVMGSRGLGALRGMLGSVSYGVLRSAEIPVLVAKEPGK